MGDRGTGLAVTSNLGRISDTLGCHWRQGWNEGEFEEGAKGGLYVTARVFGAKVISQTTAALAGTHDRAVRWPTLY